MLRDGVWPSAPSGLFDSPGHLVCGVAHPLGNRAVAPLPLFAPASIAIVVLSLLAPLVFFPLRARAFPTDRARRSWTLVHGASFALLLVAVWADPGGAFAWLFWFA